MRRRAEILWVAAIALLALACGPSDAQGKSRVQGSGRGNVAKGAKDDTQGTILILNCFANLTRIDAISGRLRSGVTLPVPKRPPPAGTSGESADSVVDGCGSYGLLAQGGVLYTLAPIPGTETDDGRRFKLVGYSLSTYKPVFQLGLEQAFGDAVFRDGGEPALRSGLDGGLEVIGHGKVLKLTGGKLTPTTGGVPVVPGSTVGADGLETLMLAGYSLRGMGDPGQGIGCEELERTGSVVLVRLIASDGFVYGVVDIQRKTLVRLEVPFKTTETGIHLAPGGKAVVAQEGSYGKVAGLTYAGGRVAVLDAATGKSLRTVEPVGLKGKYTLTVTPGGKLVVYAGEKVSLVGIGPVPAETSAAVQSFARPTGPWFSVVQGAAAR